VSRVCQTCNRHYYVYPDDPEYNSSSSVCKWCKRSQGYSSGGWTGTTWGDSSHNQGAWAGMTPGWGGWDAAAASWYGYGRGRPNYRRSEDRQPKEKTPCKYYGTGRGCKKGSACPFLHGESGSDRPHKRSRDSPSYDSRDRDGEGKSGDEGRDDFRDDDIKRLKEKNFSLEKRNTELELRVIEAEKKNVELERKLLAYERTGGVNIEEKDDVLVKRLLTLEKRLNEIAGDKPENEDKEHNDERDSRYEDL
jgi:hypothetical protein